MKHLDLKESRRIDFFGQIMGHDVHLIYYDL